MNIKQRILIAAGSIMIILMGIFPPWKSVGDFKGQHYEQPMGYHFISRSTASALLEPMTIDLKRLVIQWVCVIALLGGLAVISGRKKSQIEDKTKN
jgi:hypothetical protein